MNAMTPTELALAIEVLDVATIRHALNATPSLANEPVDDREQQTMLSLAICQGSGTQVSDEQLGIVQALIEAGARLDEKSAVSAGMYPLGVAAWLGKLAIVNLLLDAGADVDAEPEPTDTAISVAADHRHADVVERLIEAGARHTARPLAQAGLIKRLSERLDQDPEAVNRSVDLGHLNGTTGPPLLGLVEDYGFADPHLPAVARLLLERGADVNLPDSNGHTALQLVRRKRHSCDQSGVDTRYTDEVIQILIDAGGKEEE
jgi:ankyrin repeat protein